MKYSSRHKSRDQHLPEFRQKLLDKAIANLTGDPDVLAVFLGGSLAKGNDDLYSDIDLRVVVSTEKKAYFVAEKQNRSRRWGNVLFFEDWGPQVAYTVAHYDCFVKIDIFYYHPNDLKPSLWLKDIKVLYDTDGIVTKIWEESSSMTYLPTEQDIELGRMPNSAGDWSKLEGQRSNLEDWQLCLLDSWHCTRNPDDIMKTMASMIPEFLRIHKSICSKYGVEEKEDLCKQVIEMVI